MSADHHRLLAQMELRFFGRIVAGQSHEIMNVLNTLNELVGLQEDILSDTAAGPPDVEKLRDVAVRVHRSVQRGVAIVRSVNGFAHTVDRSLKVIDAEESLRHIMDLAQRPAKLARTTLRHAFPPKPASVETRPFPFTVAVYTTVEAVLKTCHDQRCVTIGYSSAGRGVEITVTSADPIKRDSDIIEAETVVREIMGELGGQISARPGDETTYSYVLSFPETVPAGGGGESGSDREENAHGN